MDKEENHGSHGLARIGVTGHWREQRMIHEGSSEEIIGAAMAVPNTLKPGLDEKLYENALVIELPNRNHRID